MPDGAEVLAGTNPLRKDELVTGQVELEGHAGLASGAGTRGDDLQGYR